MLPLHACASSSRPKATTTRAGTVYPRLNLFFSARRARAFPQPLPIVHSNLTNSYRDTRILAFACGPTFAAGVCLLSALVLPAVAMDVAAAPSWESGPLPVKSNSLPASSVAFSANAGSASTEGSSTSGKMPEEVYWLGHLAIQPPVRRLPAWERVPTVAKSQLFPGTIMKRVTVPNFDATSPCSLQAKAEVRGQTDAVKAWRMKLLHRPWDGLKQHKGFTGEPLSEAAVTSMRMQARVHVANYMLGKATTAKLRAYESEYRIVPAKRTLVVNEASESERMMPGNKLPLYIEIRPLLEKAEEDGVAQVDMAKASFAHSTAILQELKHNPRKHLAAHGVPDLSSITDHTEPTSPHVMSPPRTTAEAKSPTKRDAIPSSPLQDSCKRLKAAKVDLVPATSPKAEPSPTKSASVPSTPLRELFATPKLTATHSLYSPVLGINNVADDQRPENALFTPAYKVASSSFLVGQPESSPMKPSFTSTNNLPYSAATTPQPTNTRPGNAFRVPSFLDSSSFDSPAQEAEIEHPSPSKFARPIAPTPSKWNRTESPSTPLPETPSATNAHLRADTASVAAASTPSVDCSAYNANSSVDLTNFDFGPYSLIFAACTAQTGSDAQEAKRIKDLHSRRRRQSEPLYKNTYKVQKRRSSASPQKLAQKAALAFSNDSIFSSPAPASKEVNLSTTSGTGLTNQEQLTPRASAPLHTENTPVTNEPTTATLFSTTPSIQISPAAEQTAPVATENGHTTAEHPGIFNIDVRQNPDIFGTHAVNQLAQMAEACCDGHAKVVISQENGRLIVRFKLPTEYASMFPPSQGSDESHFTTSPSAISSSPRIRFDRPQQSHGRSQARVSDLGISLGPNTRLRSPSKTRATFSSPTRPTRSSPLKLPPITQSPTEPSPATRQSGLWKRMSAQADQDATLIISDFAVSPTKAASSSPYVSVAESPLSVKGFSHPESPDLSILGTPTMSGIGVVDRNTPEHRRFSMLHAPLEGTPLVFTPDARLSAASEVTPSPYPMTPTFTQNLVTPSATSEEPELPSIEAADATSQPSPVPTASNSPSQAVNTPKSTSIPISHTSATPAETALKTDSFQTPPPIDAVESTTPTSSPPLNLSFTPVNRRTPRRTFAEVSPEVESEAEKNESESTTHLKIEEVPSAPIIAASPAAQKLSVVDDDSPGREYMREFIKRSKPRRLSTLENGSPVAQPAERLPLGAKSPNTASPQKAKRKLKEDSQSPLKKSIEPAPKRTRRTLKTPKRKDAMEIDELAAPEAATLAADGTDEADAHDDVDMEDGAMTRRSSRLRVLGKTTTANSKSAIPTPIKLNRPGTRRGAAGPVLNSSVRNEQQDLMHQTRLNTRRNKGNAEYPAQVLARRSQELQEEEVEEKMTEQSKATKDRKSVIWREPLEAHQEKSKKGKTAAKTAPQGSGITKPRKTAASQKSEGVEPRPQRMTRSRTRSQA
ncbi:hypothetical protein HJFPF1_08097 [Paramyrothecium foliicola]|nr:hypothetical protein HJFPF1_08097 [Paramyrothecium foliicola]